MAIFRDVETPVATSDEGTPEAAHIGSNSRSVQGCKLCCWSACHTEKIQHELHALIAANQCSSTTHSHPALLNASQPGCVFFCVRGCVWDTSKGLQGPE
jgi:hypothetical protein